MSNAFKPEKARSTRRRHRGRCWCKLVMCHAASLAGMREPFAEQAKIGVHDGEVRKPRGGMQEGGTLVMPAATSRCDLIAPSGRCFLRVWVGSNPEIEARETYARTTSDSGNCPQHMRLPHRHAGSGQLWPWPVATVAPGIVAPEAVIGAFIRRLLSQHGQQRRSSAQ